jgi:hypothetical protein
MGASLNRCPLLSVVQPVDALLFIKGIEKPYSLFQAPAQGLINLSCRLFEGNKFIWLQRRASGLKPGHPDSLPPSNPTRDVLQGEERLSVRLVDFVDQQLIPSA